MVDISRIEMAIVNEEKTRRANGLKRADKENEDIESSGKELPAGEQMKQVLWVLVRLVLMLGCLYVFICALGLLEDSFQLLGGKTAGKAFQDNKLLKNPVAGLMIGVLATVLVQSSSTSTSIVITMVGSGFIPIRSAIPIIMGANIGTSVTNTLVSLAQASDRNEFRRAFAGATVHDMFNWLSVLVLLPLEVAVHYLDWLTGLIVDSMHLEQQGKSPDMLKAITKPLTKLIVEVDKDVIKKSANSTSDTGDVLKRWCEKDHVILNVSHHNALDDVTVNCQQILDSTGASASTSSLHELCASAKEHAYLNLKNISFYMAFDSSDETVVERKVGRCESLFAKSDLSDSAAGAILLVCSLVVIFLALYGLVKILHSVLQGSLAKVIKKFINADLPGKAAYFTGYIAILVGTGMTMILQSSSVFTSTLTPMVGVGVVTVERMYPLTLGANIGTTLTGILAALSQEGENGHLKNALHVALCHLFFNISGIIIFYPLPFMRFPIDMAKTLGRTTAKHRWFAIMYLLILFVIIPGIIFGLSLAGWLYLGVIGGPLLFIFLVILIINGLQRKKPGLLPRALRTWNWLPLWVHSLKPVDNLIAKLCRCGFCRKLQEADLGNLEEDDDDNDHDEDENENQENGLVETIIEETQKIPISRSQFNSNNNMSSGASIEEMHNGNASRHAYENRALSMEERL